ncbi:peptidylprolyl isomerase [uncultured Enorma sp.]|uniref:peptidylprolyl isomerase n=1 Tax=uncultured Enorma sp. TaxID=1714346 RepID=UPI0025947DC3|nr:peptidylprolyl isomerase [uncultured Enorma sp.]
MASNNESKRPPAGSQRHTRSAHTAASAHTSGRADRPKTKADFKRENKEQIHKGIKYVLVGIGVLAMVLTATSVACSGILNQVASDEEYKLTGGIAATVNGTKITEDTVTEQIMSTRSSMGYDDDADWAAYLSSMGMTPESYRENVIDGLVDDVLVSQAERDANIQVSDEDVEAEWQDIVSNYDSEDAFVQMLEQLGYTESTYKETIRQNLESEAFRDSVAPVEEPTDDEVIAYANENLSTYNDARRSSHILIKVADDADDATREEAKAKAQEILDKINAGEISFEDAAKEYSEDSSASDGGDVGWDKLTTFVDAYQQALSALDTGQVSGVVETDYGYHIIMCTDRFYVDGEVTSVDQIPEDLRNTFIQSIESTNQSAAYQAWLDQQRSEADIQINDMPDDVPYNVDMDAATTEGDDAQADDAATE